MENRLAKLERLAQLRDEGTLTAEEFAAEKARIFSEADSPQAQSGPASASASALSAGAANPARAQRPRATSGVIILIGIAAFAAAGGYYYVRKPADVPLPTTAPIAQNEASPPVPASPEPVAEPLVLDGTIQFSNPSNCQADKATEALFDNVLTPPNGDIANVSAKSIRVGDQGTEIRPVFTKTVEGEEDDMAFKSVADFPQPASWHNLRVREMSAELDVIPGSDNIYTRQIRFLETPDDLRAALNRLGFAIPASPDYASLTDDACGGSMQVMATPGGSALQCSWGC